MAYVGETPWHGLGVQVEQAMTSEEAIQLGGLTWEVDSKPIYVNTGRFTEIENKKAVVRRDTGKVLGVVGNWYTPVQNRQAFEF